MPGRVDWVGAALLAIAAAGAWMSHGARSEAARWYAEVAAYNRSITAFLMQNSAALEGRPVAVFGVGGLSPWSLSAGGYLTKLVGSPNAWQVFVPGADAFYPLGRLANGVIDVLPESKACAEAATPGRVHLIFDPLGRGRLATSCEDALRSAYPPPTIDAWDPKAVSSAQAEAGFNMLFTGTNLGAGVDVSVGGKPLAMVRAKQGRLMTTTVPPGSDVQGLVRFSVDHRGKSVMHGEVKVGSAN